MLKGWLAQSNSPEIWVVDPKEEFQRRAEDEGANAASGIAEIPADFSPDLVIAAVKPQLVETVIEGASKYAARGATYLSVAAGISISSIEKSLSPNTPVIRCMPNTPAAIGQGMMVLSANAHVASGTKEQAEQLMASSGVVTWVDEMHMDAVTAISGSGPAYVFHFVEALSQAAEALGLSAETASLLAKQTVAGAGAMMMKIDTPPTTLREQVTSPNGTTAAALDVMMTEGRFAGLLMEATEAARDRSVELGKA